MVDNDVLGFDVSMHDALGVRVVQSLQHLVDVVLAVSGSQQSQECLVVGLLHVLED